MTKLIGVIKVGVIISKKVPRGIVMIYVIDVGKNIIGLRRIECQNIV